MALIAALLGPMAVLASGCMGSGANGEDERRVEIMTADPLLTTVAPGGSITHQPEGETTDSESPFAVGGGTNSAGAVHELAGTEGGAARFYAAALVAQGWTVVEAVCTTMSDTGRTLITVSARRWYDDFEGHAAVGVEPPPGGGMIRVLIAINAPFHSETGTEPQPTPPRTDCIDALP